MTSRSEREFDRYAADYEQLLRDPIRDRFANSSDFFHRRKWDVLSDFLRRGAVSTRQARWLDVGCGKQELLRLGRHAFAEVAGCDPSDEMLHGSADIDLYLQQDPKVLPFDDECFDLVTAACVFHHVEPRDRDALTLEVRRVLKPGGLFSVIEHNPLNPITQLVVRRSPIDVNARLLTAGSARRLMRRAGFRPLMTTYFLYLPSKIYAVASQVERLLGHLPGGGQYAVFAAKHGDSGR